MGPLPEELLRMVIDAGGFLVRCSALVLVLFFASRLPVFRQLFYHTEHDSRTQVLYTLFWTLAAFLAPHLTEASAFVPFFAGRFGGMAPGYTVGAAAGAMMAFTGYSLPSVFVQVAAGLAGGLVARRLGPGKRSPGWLALAAGVLSLAGMDRPDFRGEWFPAELLGHGALVPLVYLTLAFSLACLLFLRLMEHLMTEGERERARASHQVLELAREAAEILSRGLSDEAGHELAARIRDALEVPGVCLLTEGRVTAFAGTCPHIAVAEEFPEEQEVDHTQVFPRCPEGCSYTTVVVVPLRDGLRTLAYLGLLQTRQQALLPVASTAALGLGTVLSGLLSQARVLEQRAALEESRFQFLQAQIRPHFLFNALNTIASLARKDPKVRDTVLHLARFLRESFQQDRDTVELEQELEVVRAYLAIEKERFGDRLVIEYDIPEPVPECTLPPFTLQPLVENAVRHGISDSEVGGRVTLRVGPEEEGVRVSVEDTGAGFTQEALALAQAGQNPEGIGLANVRDRLRGAFGEELEFTIDSQAGEGTRISFLLPVRSKIALESTCGGR